MFVLVNKTMKHPLSKLFHTLGTAAVLCCPLNALVAQGPQISATAGINSGCVYDFAFDPTDGKTNTTNSVDITQPFGDKFGITASYWGIYAGDTYQENDWSIQANYNTQVAEYPVTLCAKYAKYECFGHCADTRGYKGAAFVDLGKGWKLGEEIELNPGFDCWSSSTSISKTGELIAGWRYGAEIRETAAVPYADNGAAETYWATRVNLSASHKLGERSSVEVGYQAAIRNDNGDIVQRFYVQMSTSL